jgi:hypothetical protein
MAKALLAPEAVTDDGLEVATALELVLRTTTGVEEVGTAAGVVVVLEYTGVELGAALLRVSQNSVNCIWKQ